MTAAGLFDFTFKIWKEDGGRKEEEEEEEDTYE